MEDNNGRIRHRLVIRLLSLTDSRLPHEVLMPKGLNVLNLQMRKDCVFLNCY